MLNDFKRIVHEYLLIMSTLQCGKRRDTCNGQSCIDYFQNIIAAVGKRMCDIKGAGAMGKGVFANRRIPSGSVIGEYLGRLYPLGSLQAQDRYVFLISEIAEVTAIQFGNFTRFVNHHCNASITPRLGMYGKRQVILYEVNRDVEAGEQLFVHYGMSYFNLPYNPCKCDAQEGDHVPVKSKPRASVRDKVVASNVKTSEVAAQTRSKMFDKSSITAHRDGGPRIATKSTIPTRDPRAVSGKKHSREQSAVLSNTLTRSARVQRRHGPQVFTSRLR